MKTRQQYFAEKKEAQKKIQRAKLVRHVATAGTGVMLLSYAGGLTEAATHRVAKGETLSKIASQYGVKVIDIVSDNRLSNPNYIYAGQTLSIGRETRDEKKQVSVPKATAKTTSYTVKAGDTLSAISHQYGVSVKDIQTQNRLSSDVIRVGQVLQVGGKTVISEKVASKTNPKTPSSVSAKNVTHVVKQGDTLWSLSRTYGTSIERLLTLNNLQTTTLKIGQKVMVKGEQSNKKPSTTSPKKGVNPLGATYTVQAGDSLIGLAKRFGTSVMAIREINRLQTDAIIIGQKVVIPSTVVESKYGTINGIVDSTSIEVSFPGEGVKVLEIAYGSAKQYDAFVGKTREIIYAEGKKGHRGALIVIR